jgi:HAD superfamily hydrolase (TIGR01549 family)
MLTTPIHTLIFDLDNTLIDRNAAMRLALKDWLQAQGYEAAQLQTALHDSMQFDNWGYTGRSACCNWLLTTYGKSNRQKITPQVLLALLQQQLIQHLQPDEQINASLHALASDFRLVLASNGGSTTQRAKLRQAQLETFFQPEAIFISGEMGCEKPDHQFFKTIIRQLQLDAGGTMVIGDNLIHDIQAAQACGLHTCWVSHGRENTTTIRPHEVITNITETAKWSKQLT